MPDDRQSTAATCCYCGVGCGVLIEHDGQRILGVRGDPAHPANQGRLCSKGASLHLSGDLASRALYPELRLGKTLGRSRTDWDSALEHAAERFAATIREHGRQSVAFYVSGQLLTEDYYAFNKLARALIGTPHIDSNSRLCMSSAVVGYKRSLGADAPPSAYEDVELADCVLIIGANPAFAHPVLFRRLEAAKAQRPQMRVIVVDPRRTDSCELADLHLPLQPGTDVALLHGLLHILLRDQRIDHRYIAEHTEGFEALQSLVQEYPPERVSQLCGLHEDALEQAARWIGDAPGFLSLWCMGLNQSSSGSAKNSALINLHLATGQIGRPGAGPFSLTGQPNAMGGRESGTLANLLPGHREADNAEHRAEVARYWGVDSIPGAGLSAVELFDAVADGRIQALWIACTNPAQSMPDQQRIHAALAACPFVIVQEAFASTETCAYADLLLPAASWGEKAGTVTNSERRISPVRQAVPPPGAARPDWAIVCDFARRLEQRLRPGLPSLFAFDSALALFEEFTPLTAGRDLDYSGLSHALLDRLGPQQWPFPAGARQGTPRLYANGRFPTPSGRARFIAEPYRAPLEAADRAFPLLLNTGRLRDQWHGMSRTGSAAQSFGHAPEPLLGLHPHDLAGLGLRGGDLVTVASRRGKLVLPAQSDPGLRRGHVWLPMHWGDRFLQGLGSNVLSQPGFDPLSRQPELKLSAVSVTPIDLPWRLYVLVEGCGLSHLDALRPLLADFPYASLGLLGRERTALVIRAAHHQAPPRQWLARLDRMLALREPLLAYDDPDAGISKRLRLEQGRLTALRLAGETLGRDWLTALWRGGEPIGGSPYRLLAPTPGETITERLVCNCLNVTAERIQAGLTRGLGLAELQRELRCGTQCGSCLPEIRRMVRSTVSGCAIP
ncbi:MAG TPA: molybdopterin-dependent oxidoreductase [Pseudomonas sp.]|nr:molybdopterin-dependent oxidoreductase [Pseudomonas sp.]